jgi:hypothetical protein
MSMPLPSILQPGSIAETVSELNVINTRLQDFFIGGGGTKPNSGRYFGWDVFNETREVAGGRAPGTPPSRIAPQPVGHVNGVFPRVHETIPLLYEEIHNLRRIGGNPQDIDVAGESYIVGQEEILAQRFANHKEFQFVGMCRGKYYYTQTGDDIAVSLTSGAQEINFQVPAGNQGQLDMLGGGDIIGASWATSSTDIPAHLFAIDAAFEELMGLPLRHAWCNSNTFNYVLKNDEVKELSGTANVVFDRFERIAGTNDFIVMIKGLPWIQWHVTNGVLKLDGATTKLFANDEVLFCPDPNPSWVQYYEGSEVVIEYPGATPTERYGTYFWAEPTTKPAGYELTGVHNGIPALKIPNAIAFADVTP